MEKYEEKIMTVEVIHHTAGTSEVYYNIKDVIEKHRVTRTYFRFRYTDGTYTREYRTPEWTYQIIEE